MIASFSLLDASITYDADNQLQHHLIHIATTADGTNNDFESMIKVLKDCCEYVAIQKCMSILGFNDCLT